MVSRNEILETSALASFRALARQITNGEIVLNIVQYLFNILNGLFHRNLLFYSVDLSLLGTDSSISKLSVISQRENVLSAIGFLSRTSSNNLSHEDILKFFEKYFYPIIQQEVHEGLIGHMLQQMTNWASRLTNINPALTEFFKVRNNEENCHSFIGKNFSRKDWNKRTDQQLLEQLIFNAC